MNKNVDIKKTITKVVSATLATEKGKKATGTVIAQITRDIPIISIGITSL